MMNLVYIYPKKIAKDNVATLLDVFSTQGVTLTHLGKNDPPAKWSGDITLATEVILAGQDLTLWTFFRAKKLKIEGTIEIHRDPRWTHDSISISGEDIWLLQTLATSLHSRMDAYLTIMGKSGGGKDQEWTVIGRRSDCPKEMLARIRCAEPSVGGDGKPAPQQ
jgi:hypothetical protein